MKPIGKYKNGNYTVVIFDDGTKIRENKLDFFRADFPESMDIKICDRCDMNCPMCHENSTKDGAIGDILSERFIDKLHPYTELAIGGGNPLEHPDLVPFLEKCKRLKLIPNITVNQVYFLKNKDFLKELTDKKLIYGLGVSLISVTNELLETLDEFPNVVLHVINGIVTTEQLSALSYKGLKILILGYKEFRRGYDMYQSCGSMIEANKKSLYDSLEAVVRDGRFDVVSFDNLAAEQLDMKRLLTEDEWEQYYMGDDGTATMYIDMVKREFAKNSTSMVRYPLEDDIVTMFEKIRTN